MASRVQGSHDRASNSGVSTETIRERLLRELWNSDPHYYEVARAHVQEAAHRGREYDFIRRHLPPQGVFLEVGCGEGSNLDVLAGSGRRFVGCDLSRLALGLAREHAPSEEGRRFICGEAEALAFLPGSFDAVLGISVLEHIACPERALSEMVDVLRPGGRLILVSPQYGGPLGASPCRGGGGGRRFVRRFVSVHLPSNRGRTLRWETVHPLVLEGVEYDGDRDTVVEPELRSLRKFLRERGVQIDVSTSGLEWYSWNDQKAPLAHRLVRSVVEGLGRLKIPPYRDLGPLVAIAGTKLGESRNDG